MGEEGERVGILRVTVDRRAGTNLPIASPSACGSLDHPWPKRRL